MRTLLFVQTGDARPKCVKSFGWISGDGSAGPRALQYLHSIRFGADGQPDSGWLVACENAEAGRAIIAEGASGEVTIRLGSGLARGRIIASGGTPAARMPA